MPSRAIHHHLRETGESNTEDIGNVKRELRRIRHHA
jgi:hypothetical protein